MSAESKDSRASIDDILSSIREIIADEGANDPGRLSAQTEVSRGSGEPEHEPMHAKEPAAQPRGAESGKRSDEAATTRDSPNSSDVGEEVLDLSEEFIVTEVTAAIRQEQERLSESSEETADPAQEGQRADGSSDDLLEASVIDDADEADDQPNTRDHRVASAAHVWEKDFQMPVGEEGPASPFSAARTHPESTWPEDPWDVTETYHRARTSKNVTHLRNSFAEAGEEPRDDVSSSTPEEQSRLQDTEEAHGSPPQGVELASLSEVQSEDPEDPEQQAAADASEHPSSVQSDPALVREHAFEFDTAEEVEAVFGMPPHRWWGTTPNSSAHQSDAAENTAENDAPEEGATVEIEHTPAQSLRGNEDKLAAHDENDISSLESQDGADPSLPEQDRENENETVASAVVHSDNQLKNQPDSADGPDRLDQSVDAVAAESGKSLEDSVKELLRPMLQEWLDKNMPRLVEAAMREQIVATRGRAEPADETDEDDSAATDARDDTSN